MIAVIVAAVVAAAVIVAAVLAISIPVAVTVVAAITAMIGVAGAVTSAVPVVPTVIADHDLLSVSIIVFDATSIAAGVPIPGAAVGAVCPTVPAVHPILYLGTEHPRRIGENRARCNTHKDGKGNRHCN